MASFLDLFTAVDSDGVSASRYRLHYQGSQFQNQDSWIFGMATELIYVGFQLLIIPANALLGLVFSSGSWLGPLSRGYQQVMAPIFAVVPPWAIACFGMGIVALSLLMSRPTATTSKIFNSAALNRIGTALAMVVVVLVVTHDPFALMAKVLELANSFAVDLAAAVTGSSHNTTLSAGQALVDSSARTPTIALNYGREFSAECSTKWSEAMLAGEALSENSGCFVKGQNTAGADTIGTALVMLILPALPMLFFSVIAAWKYLLHLTMAVLNVLALGWIAAGSVHRRRGFDYISKTIARAGAHLVMVVITSMVAVALPTLCAGLAVDLLGLVSTPQAQAFALMVSLGIGFAISTWAIIRITSNSGLLARALHADAAATLEHTLGIHAKPPQKLALAAHKFNPLATPKDDAAGKASGKTSELSADPVAATSSREVEGATPNRSIGVNAVNNQASGADEEATRQLMAPAVSVAEAAAEPAAAPVELTSHLDPTQLAANRTWQQSADDSGQSVADTSGYYFDLARIGVHSGSVGAAGVPVAPVAPGVAGISSGDNSGSALDLGASRLAQLVAPGGVSANGSRTGGLREESALAPQTRRPPDDSGDVPAAAPVDGNVYGDPALDSAARRVGATFTAGGTPPAGRRLMPWIRGFTKSAPAKRAAFTPPEVQYAPPLTVAAASAPTDTESTVDELTGSGGEGDSSKDQQWWNRLSRLRRRRTAKDVTSPQSEAELPLSGIAAGVNKHPGSYCAASADFLATDALQVQMDEIVAALAATGKRVSFVLSPADLRVGVQLSSDPKERVKSRGVNGFGDP